MKIEIDFNKVVPINMMFGESEEETKQLCEYLDEAKEYINYYSWHHGINNSYYGIGVGGIFAIFLFEIIPNREDIDNYVWVIVGDIPPAYITCEDAPNPACALDIYIGAMSESVQASIAGESVESLIPVNVPATPENGEMLKSRLEFLGEKVLSNYEKDLEA